MSFLLSDIDTKTIKQIEQYYLGNINFKIHQEIKEDIFYEFLKFLEIKIIFRKSQIIIIPSQIINEIWKQVVLDTNYYLSILKFINLKKEVILDNKIEIIDFIHFNDYSKINESDLLNFQNNTVIAYQSRFNKNPPEIIWNFKKSNNKRKQNDINTDEDIANALLLLNSAKRLKNEDSKSNIELLKVIYLKYTFQKDKKIIEQIIKDLDKLKDLDKIQLQLLLRPILMRLGDARNISCELIYDLKSILIKLRKCFNHTLSDKIYQHANNPNITSIIGLKELLDLIGLFEYLPEK